MDLRLGLFGINMDVCATDGQVLVRTAEVAEQAGWESVWTGEHYVLPADRTRTPAPPDTALLDPFVALALAAGRTSRLLLGTGVTVVPLHQPLALAKRVASLDVASAGRLLFGVGVGYLEPEFEALAAPFDHRGDRTDEYLAAMRAIWAQEAPTFEGRFVSFSGVRAEPRPVQRPAPPLHVGGYAPASFRRAVQHGHGWYGFALDLDGVERAVQALRYAADEVERPVSLPPLEISVTPHPRLTLDIATVDRLAALGVDRLVVMPPPAIRRNADDLIRFMETLPDQLTTP